MFGESCFGQLCFSEWYESQEGGDGGNIIFLDSEVCIIIGNKSWVF